MKKQMPYSTPEGYFENARQRLGAIPQSAQKVRPVQRFSPYLALAAIFAAAFVIGNVLLSRTAIPAASEDEIIEYLLVEDVSLASLENYMDFN